MISGMGDSEVGDLLGLEAQTVRYYCSSGYKKLGVHNLAEAAVEGIRQGYWSTDDFLDTEEQTQMPNWTEIWPNREEGER
jgi:hypothetical protein